MLSIARTQNARLPNGKLENVCRVPVTAIHVAPLSLDTSKLVIDTYGDSGAFQFMVTWLISLCTFVICGIPGIGTGSGVASAAIASPAPTLFTPRTLNMCGSIGRLINVWDVFSDAVTHVVPLSLDT